MSTNWFESVFGFSEGGSYSVNRSQFQVSGDGTDDVVLTSSGNGQAFHVGPFTIPTVAQLRLQLAELSANKKDSLGDQGTLGGLGLTFRHVHGDVRSFIRSPESEGSVFQVASQFNCLEMVGPGVSPDRGISIYAQDPTQGPACALACPAATAFRNYYAPGGKGQGGAGERNQINTMLEVEQLLKSSALASPSATVREHFPFWSMSNGYLLPTTTRSMAVLTSLLGSKDSELSANLISRVAVGVHWSTEVHTATRHRVAQVFSSAVPVAYCKGTKSEDWSLFAALVLQATFEATLLVGAILARQKGRRVSVFLTAVGGGAFGNRIEWIVEAIQRALDFFRAEPVDVLLVHYGSVVPAQMKRLAAPKATLAAVQQQS
jgi:hypothetical protein